jgi:hypothetical protein
MVTAKRQKKGGIVVRKTVAVDKNSNGVLPSALAIGVGLIR